MATAPVRAEVEVLRRLRDRPHPLEPGARRRSSLQRLLGRASGRPWLERGPVTAWVPPGGAAPIAPPRRCPVCLEDWPIGEIHVCRAEVQWPPR